MKDPTKNIIGLILCVIGIFIYSIPLAKLFILIPVIIFLISLLINKRIWSIILNIIPLIPFILLYLGSIIPISKSIIIESRIRYQVIDIDIGNVKGNKRVFLQDTANGIHWLYVDSSDFKKLWPEPPFTMKEKNYTIKAKFKTYKLLSGEYAKATILEYDSIAGCPMITK